MLLRFEVGNFLSFAENQEMSLVASKLKGPEDGLLTIPSTVGLRAVPAALIYGANASGKTNLIDAFAFFRRSILNSHSGGKPNGGTLRSPFALDDAIQSLPSRFEVEFVVEGCRYIYGFTCDDKIYLEEWLYTFPEGKRRKLFERKENYVEFGPTMPSANKKLVEFMRNNSLFISTATQNSHALLTKVVEFFGHMRYSNKFFETDMMRTPNAADIDGRTIKFLDATGAGIVGYEKHETEIPEEIKKVRSKISSVLKEIMPKESEFSSLDESYTNEIKLKHRGRGKDVALPFISESSGTRRLVFMMNEIFAALDDGNVVFVDEFDMNLHSLVAEQILALFTNPLTNPKGAQLVTTTHDTNILGSSHLRRDQIWFCEKTNNGASHLYSLADFKLREGDNFEKGYLEGRFGAIPFAGDISSIFNAKGSV